MLYVVKETSVITETARAGVQHVGSRRASTVLILRWHKYRQHRISWACDSSGLSGQDFLFLTGSLPFRASSPRVCTYCSTVQQVPSFGLGFAHDWNRNGNTESHKSV